MAGEQIPIVDPSGITGTVSEEELPAMLQAGGRVQTPEETAAAAEKAQYETLGEAAKAGLERFASGATIGLSDVALAEGLGDEYTEARARRERLFPVLGQAAEVGGMIAPLVLSEGAAAGGVASRGLGILGAPVRGAAAVGRGAEALAGAGLRGLGVTGESILGRGVLRGTQFAASGAAEGALYGAGHALSEEALAGGNYNRLGEKLWAGAKEGLSVGAAIGGPLGFVGGAGTRAVERGFERLAGAKGLQSIVQKFGDEQIARSLGATGTDIKNLGRTVGTREQELAAIAKEVRAAKLRDGTQVFKAFDDAEDLAEKLSVAKREAGDELGKFRQQIDDLGNTDPALRPNVKPLFKEVDDMVRAAEGGPRTLHQRALRASEEIEGLRQLDATGGTTFKSLTDWRQKLDDVIYPKSKGRGLPAMAPENQAQLIAIRNSLEGAIETATEKAAARLGADTSGRYDTLKNSFRRLTQAEDIATGAAGRAQGNRSISLTDYLTGIGTAAAGIASGSVLPLIAGGAGALVNKVARERGSSVLAVLADRVAKVDRKIDSGVSQYIKRLSDTRRGAIGELSGEDVEHRNKLDRALGKRPSETRADAYKRKVDQVTRFSVNALPQLQQRIGSDVAAAATQTTMAAAQTAVRGMRFLQSKIPAPLKNVEIALPQLQDRTVAPIEAAKFARYVEVVDDPMAVLDHMKEGTLTGEHTEALKEVYPELHTEIRDRTWQQLAEMKEPPPYIERVRFGRLWGLPTSRSLQPASVARAQGVYKERNELAAQPAAPPRRSGGGSVGEGLASRVDQLESAELTV